MTRILRLLIAAALLLGGCIMANQLDPLPTNGPSKSTSDDQWESAYTVTCRIISGAESGTLLLANLDPQNMSGVYRLSTKDLPIQAKDGREVVLQDGMTVEIAYGGSVQTTFPAHLDSPKSITVTDRQKGLSSLYLQVLNDLWDEDSALNEDREQISVDLSETTLTPSEREAVAWAFGEQHDLAFGLVTLSHEELIEEGYLSGDKPPYYWENGCLFTIREKESDDKEITFEAMKWTSGLSAYMFTDCTAVYDQTDGYTGYEVGAYAIS